MKRKWLEIGLIAVAASGCSSEPPRPDAYPANGGHRRPSATGQDMGARVLDPGLRQVFARTPGEEYQRLAARPPADSRSLRVLLDSQMFEYSEDGQALLRGPVSSGTPSSPTPVGKFSIRSKEKDKVSSLYENEIGTQAWMPYSMQFIGNYFLHEGWLPGHPASHGCVRLGHHHAKLLFERMKIGDPVRVEH